MAWYGTPGGEAMPFIIFLTNKGATALLSPHGQQLLSQRVQRLGVRPRLDQANLFTWQPRRQFCAQLLGAFTRVLSAGRILKSVQHKLQRRFAVGLRRAERRDAQ